MPAFGSVVLDDRTTLYPVWLELAGTQPQYLAAARQFLPLEPAPRLAAASFIRFARLATVNPDVYVGNWPYPGAWIPINTAALSPLAADALASGQAIYDRELQAVRDAGGAGGASDADRSKTLEELFGAALQHPTMELDPDTGEWVPLPGYEPPDPGSIPMDAAEIDAAVAAAIATPSSDVAGWANQCISDGGWPIVKHSAALAFWFWPESGENTTILACRFPVGTPPASIPDLELLPADSPAKEDVRAPIGVQFRWWIDHDIRTLQAATASVRDYITRGLGAVAETAGEVVVGAARGLARGLGVTGGVLLAAAAVAAYLFLS